MGKNQAYKAMQRARVGSSSGGPEDVEDGMTDGSFHSPAWHAARLASLKTSHTVTWEEFKRKQKEDETKKGELEADKDKMMREYRAQLDAERASKLAHGRNHSSHKSHHKKEKKEKDHKKRSSKKRKVCFFQNIELSMLWNSAVFIGRERNITYYCGNQSTLCINKHSRRSSESSSSESSSDYSSEDEERESRRSKSKRKKKESKRRSKTRSRHSRSDSEESNGPLPLSRFFGGVKS